MFWFKPASLHDGAIVSKWTAGAAQSWTVRVKADGAITSFAHDGTSTQSTPTPPSVYSTGQTICGVVLLGGGHMRLFLDTKLISRGEDYTLGWDENVSPLRIGFAGYDAHPFADGLIDEVMIFNRRLTVDEIRTLSRAAAVAKDFAAGSVLKAGMPVDIDLAHHVEARSTATFDGSAISPDFGTWSRIGSVLTYTPTDTGLDTDNYTYTVDDGDLGSDGGTITIEAVDEAPAPEDNYATEAMGIANLLAYWRLADASAGALADASGNGHNGSYNGSPMFRVGDLTEAWQASDGFAVNLAGNGHGIVSHNAAFAPARGSLGFWFRVNSLTGSPELITKGSNFRIRVTSSGAFECLIGSMTLATIAGVIGAGGVTIAPSSRCRLFGEHSRLTRIRRVTRDDQNGIEVESGSHFSRVDHCFVGISTRRPNRPAAMPGCGCGSRARTLRTTHGTRWSTIAT